MAGSVVRFTAFILLAATVTQTAKVGSQEGTSTHGAMNPIRKVVTMLQMMTEKVRKEGAKEEELYKKFMCYCKNSGADLKESIAAAENKSPELQSEIETSTAEKAEQEAALKQAQTDRAAAKEAMAEATSIREKEAASFAAESDKYNSFSKAIAAAVKALEKGMEGSFLQTKNAQVLRSLALGGEDMPDADRQALVSFLSAHGSSEYAPQSGEITGILKQMGDEMAATLAEATATEEAGIASYGELMAAKKKEVVALTASVESKMTRIGELGVKITELKNDLGSTLESLEEDKKFLAQLEKGCSTKTAEWEERSKTRAEELVALADTIKVLNDDDALELFKKTLPAPSASFVQLRVTRAEVQARARELLLAARSHSTLSRPRLDFIALALRGQKADFSKVITMIDEMAALLKEEQADDLSKKKYCLKEFDTSDDKKKALELDVKDATMAIEEAKDTIATLKDEIAALTASIKALDEAVAEATALRKDENAEYKELMSSNTAAKELINYAKNRLNAFYNPKLYKAPAKTELSAEDRIVVEMGGTITTTTLGGIAGTGIALAQVSAAGSVAPPPPPETFGAYTTKSQENTGVIAMMDLLIGDLDKEMQEAEVTEKNSQEEYVQMMKDSAEKRATDSKALVSKEGAKADTEAALAGANDAKASATKELAATLEAIGALHSECDWLLKYFDVRKEARVGELESLDRAKAVLSGADYSLLQVQETRGLRRRA